MMMMIMMRTMMVRTAMTIKAAGASSSFVEMLLVVPMT
jgi:hypothetical protein